MAQFKGLLLSNVSPLLRADELEPCKFSELTLKLEFYRKRLAMDELSNPLNTNVLSIYMEGEEEANEDYSIQDGSVH